MSDKKNPKEILLDCLLNITREFEETTGVEIERIDFIRVDAHELTDISKSIISQIKLKLK